MIIVGFGVLYDDRAHVLKGTVAASVLRLTCDSDISVQLVSVVGLSYK